MSQLFWAASAFVNGWLALHDGDVVGFDWLNVGGMVLSFAGAWHATGGLGLNRAERNHVRALYRGLQANGLLPMSVEDDLTDGFTSFEEAHEVLEGLAHEAGFAESVWGRPA